MRTASENLGEGAGRSMLQANSNAQSADGQFRGADSPRELRAIAALMRRPQAREHIDREAGCSNGPDLVASLRRKGLELPCDRVNVLDRDGAEVRRGTYNLLPADRVKINRWLSHRGLV